MSVKSPTNFAERLYFRLDVLLRAVNLRHGTHGFTSLTKEVILRIFTLWKNSSNAAGFEPANLGSSGEYDNHGTTGVDFQSFVTRQTIHVIQFFFYIADLFHVKVTASSTRENTMKNSSKTSRQANCEKCIPTAAFLWLACEDNELAFCFKIKHLVYTQEFDFLNSGRSRERHIINFLKTALSRSDALKDMNFVRSCPSELITTRAAKQEARKCMEI